MREIKFRAWDIKNKGWISTCNMVMSLDGREFGWNFGCEPLKVIGKNEFNLMQFTGLLDKQGKEIYEGDIIEYDGGFDDAIAVIDFLDGCFVICEKREGKVIKLLKDDKEIEVIGNIYENPELLKQKVVEDG